MSMPAHLTSAPQLSSSPIKGSPKRRKFAAGKKGLSVTPKKKSPGKGLKRGVRWRDDTEEGTLAEFEKTPKRLDSSPDDESTALIAPPLNTFVPDITASTLTLGDGEDSSPITAPPIVRLENKPQHSRFKTGFLAKKSDGSPLPPSLTNLSSDSEHSPLQDLEPSRAGNRSSLQKVQNAYSDPTPPDSANNSGSDREDQWKKNRSELMHIRNAVKRVSSAAPVAANHMNRQRRRSPTAASAGSPPNENMFTASHARRMVKSDKENDFKASILSPRTAPVIKTASQRRITLGDGRSRETSIVGREAARMSTAVIGNGAPSRGSLMPGGKGVWR